MSEAIICRANSHFQDKTNLAKIGILLIQLILEVR